jgi:hypothetical protein
MSFEAGKSALLVFMYGDCDTVFWSICFYLRGSVDISVDFWDDDVWELFYLLSAFPW